jgi:hypothetical protein
MPNTGCRFEHTAIFKSEPLDGVVCGRDDSGRRVMRVERRSASEFVFLGREQFFEALPFEVPFVRSALGKYLGNTAPTNVPDEDALFVSSRFAAFRVESVDKLDRREVVPAFLFQ